MPENNGAIWTDNQILLQQWLSLPKRERKPKTLALLAPSLDVDPATLYRWKRMDGFMDEVKKFIRSELEDDISEIYGALRKEAKAGSFQHIKLALELNGDYVQKIAPTSPNGKEPYDSGLSDEQRANRIASILNGARERRDRQSADSDEQQ